MPFYRSQQGLTGKLLGGWQISGIAVYNSGLPFTPATSSFDAGGLGNVPALVAGNRPNILCDPNENAPHDRLQYFNTACLQLNPTNTTSGVRNVIGNAGRGVINGPSTQRMDFSVFKNLRFGEGVNVQLRGEAFNIFNHTNFRTIVTNVTAANYGQVSVVRDPRTIQLGAKIIC